jgi:hypothetical protein
MSGLRNWLFWLLLTCVASCAGVPEMKTLDPARDQALFAVCNTPFVSSPYRFTHAIEAALPGGRTATLIGVTAVDPARRTLHSVLMTLEGLVLFDGKTNGTLEVNRALPPFDKEPVARNMMGDVRLLFLTPPEPAVEAGKLRDGSLLCRRLGVQGETIDILVRPDRTWRMETYTTPWERLRTVDATAIVNGIPGELVLKGYVNGNYTLNMKLVDADPAALDETAPPVKEANP